METKHENLATAVDCIHHPEDRVCLVGLFNSMPEVEQCLSECDIGPMKKMKYPPKLVMAGTFLRDGKRYVAHRRPKRSEDEVRRITKICEECTFWVEKSSRCKMCGCKMRRKIAWATSRCKIGKWNSEV